MSNAKYTIEEQLTSTSQFLMYRAIPTESNETVVLKMLSSPYPSQHALNRIQTEYSILQNLPEDCIVHATALENIESKLVLILEDNKEISLSEHLKKSLSDLKDFFSIAIQLAKAVNALHVHKVLHKNITPSNILINTETKKVKLTGFSFASKIAREALFADSKEALEVDLTYISPEQTGRINSTLDFRSDLYSLGTVLYEVLTGQPPFVSDDSLEMVHSHIARKPKPPGALRNIPKSLSPVILKLLEKSKENRYQAASGLLFDLQRCFELYNNNMPDKEIVTGERDISDQFRIPEKIYGREEELNQITGTLNRVKNGPAEMLVVAGYSGVGKSRLVKQIQKGFTDTASFFISGKFDQFKKDEPLSALLAALKELIRELLTQGHEQIEEWRKKVLESIGNNGQLIIEVLPEAELLIGKQAAVPILPPAEAKNRFNETFNSFIKAFCKEKQPLCVFLDDLQWMDSATRQWIENELVNFSNVLLIGAYRDNEVSASHPLMLMFERLAHNSMHIQTIALHPLSADVLNEMIADTLHLQKEECRNISEIIFQKTNGNPFFTRQCLLSLYENNAIFFDAENLTWSYDLHLVQQAKISDNVIELMVQLIQRLPQTTQQVLKKASCIGSRFATDVLSIINNTTLAETNAELIYATEQGLIIPFNSWQKEGPEEFTFLHDKIQQALLSLLSDDERKRIHLQIARVLLSTSANIETDEKIYEIANHFNYASELVTSTEDIHKVAEINLFAGIRAKKASAYEQARNYIETAMNALPSSTLKTASAFSSQLFLQRAESEHLCGNNSIADGFYDEAIVLATAELDKARIYQRKIHYYINLGNFNEAYQTGRKAVKQLGVSIPPKFIPPLLIKEIVTYRLRLGRRKIPDIINLPEMTDERLKMAILLMSTFARAAYQIRPELCVALCFKIVNICLKHGNTEGVNVGYLAVGPIFFGAILNQKQTGYDFGQLTLALVEKYKSHAFKAETNFVIGYFAIPWRKPATEMEQYWQIAYETGLEVGDHFHTSCACCGTIQSYYMRGVNFDDIKKTASHYLEFLQRINNNEGILTLQAVQQSINNLRGETSSNISYDAPGFDETSYINELQKFGSRHFAHYYYINKMQTLYLWGEYEKAYEVSKQSDVYLKDSPGMLHTAEHHFYKALILCALYPQASAVQKLKWKKTLQGIIGKFSKYSKGSASNFIHKHQLLIAETQKIYGETSSAENAYYAAIEAATKFGYTNIVALANELLMRFHYNSGHNIAAAFHLRSAEYAYKTWGATAYAKFLHNRYLTLFDSSDAFNHDNKKSLQSVFADTNEENSLDLSTVLKSSEAISREIRLRDLVDALMKITIENAGAQRMVLLLQQQDNLVVYAESFADNNHIEIMDDVPLDKYKNIPASVVYYVSRTGNPLILEDAAASEYNNDAYIKETNPKSVLCAPLIKQGKTTGVIYVENNLASGMFTQQRVDLLVLLSGQMAISIDNALLYNSLEEKVIERTEELKRKNIQLESTLKSLQESQRRLIHAEKMASLGQMTSGIAHEIQNPLNFVINFAELSESLIDELKELLHIDEKQLADKNDDLGSLMNELQLNNEKINTHGKRAEKIVRGMMATSANIESKKISNIDAILDEAAYRAKNNFANKNPDFISVVVKNYNDDNVTINSSQESLTNAFVNLIDNALYAVCEKKQMLRDDYSPEIKIETSKTENAIQIKIKDNGEGIAAADLDKIFIPFFTTKPTGRGNTGNGLTICHQVIDNHKGEIEVTSEFGICTEFFVTLPLQ